MIGRAPTPYRMSVSAWKAVYPLLRRALPLALVAGVIAAILGGIAAAAVSAARPDVYVASAEFELVDQVHNGTTVSLSRTILAEQTLRILRDDGTAGSIAHQATAAKIDGSWVPGPGFGELSYQVKSEDPAAATKAATAVHDRAGFLGYGLMPSTVSQNDRPALDLIAVHKAAPAEATLAKTTAAGVVLGGFAGFALALLAAIPVRRPEREPEPTA
ncbi:MAG: hypothetical protein QOJ50_204 [Cryptosporangiaceae bacterium]|nr:hypothetical protein [Cryptosporangiaceae bacterium]